MNQELGAVYDTLQVKVIFTTKQWELSLALKSDSVDIISKRVAVRVFQSSPAGYNTQPHVQTAHV